MPMSEYSEFGGVSEPLPDGTWQSLVWRLDRPRRKRKLGQATYSFEAMRRVTAWLDAMETARAGTRERLLREVGL